MQNNMRYDIGTDHDAYRLRVANLCCSGEEKIIFTSLQEVNGIEDIAVNIIGR